MQACFTVPVIRMLALARNLRPRYVLSSPHHEDEPGRISGCMPRSPAYACPLLSFGESLGGLISIATSPQDSSCLRVRRLEPDSLNDMRPALTTRIPNVSSTFGGIFDIRIENAVTDTSIPSGGATRNDRCAATVISQNMAARVVSFLYFFLRFSTTFSFEQQHS